MKLRERPSSSTLTDDWISAVDTEFGPGAVTAALHRLAPVVRAMLDTPADSGTLLHEFGYALGHDSYELGVAIRGLELLAESSTQADNTALNSRSAVVRATSGWNEAVLGRNDPVNDALTPLPFFTHLVQQCYARPGPSSAPPSRGVVLVVVDVQRFVGNRLEFARVRSAIVGHLRAVFNAGQPVSEGPNGNLLAMIDRGPHLLDEVGMVRRAIEADPTLRPHALHVWIEPLATDQIHLESHLDSLVGNLTAI